MIPRLFQSPQRLGLPSWSVGLSGDRPREARYGQKFANLETGEIDEWIGDRWRIVAQNIIGLPELTDALIHWTGGQGGGVSPAPRSSGDPSITTPVVPVDPSGSCCSCGDGPPTGIVPVGDDPTIYVDTSTDPVTIYTWNDTTNQWETSTAHYYSGEFDGFTDGYGVADHSTLISATGNYLYYYRLSGASTLDSSWSGGLSSDGTPTGVPGSAPAFFLPAPARPPDNVASYQYTGVAALVINASPQFFFMGGGAGGHIPHGFHVEFWLDPLF